MVKNIISKLQLIAQRLRPSVFLAGFTGMLLALFLAQPITPILFFGKSFSNRSLGVQFLIFGAEWFAIFVLMLFLHSFLLRKIKYTKKIRTFISQRFLPLWKGSMRLALILGGVLAFIFRHNLAPVIFGKSYTGRSLGTQSLTYSGLAVLLTGICFILIVVVSLILKKKIKLDPVVILSRSNRLYAILITIGLSISLIYFLNQIIPSIDIQKGTFSYPKQFPQHYIDWPVGKDFRWGIYRPPHMLLNNEDIYIDAYSNYPPFENIFFMPLQLLDENSAYVVIVISLFLANIGSILLVSILIKDVILKKAGFSKPITLAITLFLGIAILFYTLTSYSFQFSIERGNYDALAIFFGILSIFLLIKKPQSLWLQVITLSIATHLKIYPAALFLAIFMVHKKKMLLPALLVNVAMLLSLGPIKAWEFIQVMIRYTATPGIYYFNHSSSSFADLVIKTPKLRELFPHLAFDLSFISILIWGISCYLVVKYLDTDLRSLALLMVSIPLMNVLPTDSFDYKLIIFSSSLLILLTILLVKIYKFSKFWDYVQLAIVLLFALFIGRSYEFLRGDFLLFANKFPLLMGMAVLMARNIQPFKHALSINHGETAPGDEDLGTGIANVVSQP